MSISCNFLSLFFVELIAYTVTVEAPAVLNSIDLFAVVPAPPSLILCLKLFPLYDLVLPSTVTVPSSDEALILNPSA